MANKRYTYVCFDGDKDMHYYRLLQAWSANKNHEFTLRDIHALTQSRDSSLEETIKRSLRLRMNNSTEFIVLIGESTRHLYKYVRWEIEIAIKLDIPIIAVNLNKKKGFDSDLCPPLLRDELAVHIPFQQKIIYHAIENWPVLHRGLRKDQNIGPREFVKSVYASLEL